METAAVLRVLSAPIPFSADFTGCTWRHTGALSGLPWHPMAKFNVSAPGAIIRRLAGRIEFERAPAGPVAIAGFAVSTALVARAERCYIDAAATYSDRFCMMGQRTGQALKGKLFDCRFSPALRHRLESQEMFIVDMLLPDGRIELRAWAEIKTVLGATIEWMGVKDADGQMTMSFR